MKSVLCSALLGCAALAFLPSAKAGPIFNVTYTLAVENDTHFTSIKSAVDYVSNEFATTYSDNVTLNFTVDEGAVGLGQSLFSNAYWRGSYTSLRTALVNDAKSADDATATATANLPTTDPYSAGATGWFATSAEAKALGLLSATGAASDGTYTFDNSVTYTYDPNNRGTGGYDFIGITEHEFSELMGRTNQLRVTGFFGYDIFDTMRFTGLGVRSTTVPTSGVYFSFDNGVTNLKTYNFGPPGDSQDWASGVATDPYNASTGSNQAHALNALDTRTLDVIGWDLAAPEPATFIPAAVALGLMGFLRRRRRAL